jgi:hypothetical protein
MPNRIAVEAALKVTHFMGYICRSKCANNTLPY